MEVFTLRTILGDERIVRQMWPDGSFTCPFCGSAVRATERPCPNPWCDASPYYSAERLQAERDKRAARENEEYQRKRNHAWAMERITREREERDQLYTDVRATAEQRGACVRCALHSLRYGAQEAKYTKHRNGCPQGRKAA